MADIDVAPFSRATLPLATSVAIRRHARTRHKPPSSRKGVGLVQEAANGDTGHQFCLSQLFVRVTLDSSIARAQATKQSQRCMALSYFWIAL